MTKPNLVIFLAPSQLPDDPPDSCYLYDPTFNNWLTILNLKDPYWVTSLSQHPGNSLKTLLDDLNKQYSVKYVAIGTLPRTYLKEHGITAFNLPGLTEGESKKFVAISLNWCKDWLERNR